MAITTRRGKILDNLRRQLETLTVANGYTAEIYKVTTVVHNWTETPKAETPVIYIIDEETNPRYHAGKLVEWEWQIGLYCVMRDRSQIEMEEFVSDIMQCLDKNRTLSFDGEVPGPAAQVMVMGIQTDNQLFSEIEGSQLFKVSLEVRYSSCLTNPR